MAPAMLVKVPQPTNTATRATVVSTPSSIGRRTDQAFTLRLSPALTTHLRALQSG